MHIFIDATEEFRTLNRQCQDLAASVFKKLSPEQEFARISADVNVAAQNQFRDKFLVLREGYLTYRLNHRRIFAFEQGDLIMLDSSFSNGLEEISSSFPISADVYSINAVYQTLRKDAERIQAWSEYLLYQNRLLTLALAAHAEVQPYFTPEERTYNPGEIIIEEGDEAHDVFALVDGHAEVFVGLQQVGQIKEDEFFGVLAALTGSPRLATVKAAETCRVLSVPKEKFTDLIRVRPSTIEKLTGSMARVITELNKELSEQKEFQSEENLRGG